MSSSTAPIVSTIAASVAVAIVAAIVHIVVVSIATATIIIIIIATSTAFIMLGNTLLAANPSRFWFTLVVATVVSCVHNDTHQCG